MRRSTSLAQRVAWGSAVAASLSSLVAACATSLLMAYMLRLAEDRRLEEAAITFAGELDRSPPTKEAILGIYNHEVHEMEHTGIVFAVHTSDGTPLFGDSRLTASTAATKVVGCSTQDGTLRVCSSRSGRGLTTVAAAGHVSLLPQLMGAAVTAAVLAALLVWLAIRPISRRLVAPLSRLRERIADLDVDTISIGSISADARGAPISSSAPNERASILGPAENVVEVDALRETILQLVREVQSALGQAHRFAANAAHELRTPLTSVLAELELVAEHVDEQTLRADVLRARQSLTEVSVLVERLLVLSLPHRRVHDAMEVVSLRDLLEDAVAALQVSERHRVLITDADALIAGDSVLLGTMIANAVSNALKFGARVSVDLRNVDGWAILHVDDDGPGLDAADWESVFEPFFRGQHALRLRVPGHGLGLALVRHIAQTHGGNAAFVTKAASGARLQIRLPLGKF